MPYHKEIKGYTLIEIMIAIAISLVLIAGASATYIAQNRSYVAQESISEVNTQSKIAQNIIANALKSGGFGTPAEMDLDPVNGYTAVVTQVDNFDAPDAITIVGGFRMIGTLWPNGGGPGMACPASVPLGASQVSINYSGTERFNTSDKRFISIDGVDFAQISNCTPDGNGDCNPNAITIDRSLSQSFPLVDDDGNGTCDTGRPIYLIEDVTFCVDAASSLRRIRRNANVAGCTGAGTSDDDEIAQNIEDLQFAYAMDADGDGQTDDIDSNGIIDSADFMNGNMVTDPSTIRAVRINVLARADRADPNFKSQGNPPAGIENRAHNPTNDDFRRRWWRTIVTMRNQ